MNTEREDVKSAMDIDSATRFGVATIRDIINSWVEWDEYTRRKERSPVDDEYHVMVVPCWPSRLMLKRWVECLTDAEMIALDYQHVKAEAKAYPAVKLLLWRGEKPHYQTAWTPFGTYGITHFPGAAKPFQLSSGLTEPPYNDFLTASEAMDFAQKHFEGAIDQCMSAGNADKVELAPGRSCTCHPSDNPPRPCPEKYAYSQCVIAAEKGRPEQPPEAKALEQLLTFSRYLSNAAYNITQGGRPFEENSASLRKCVNDYDEAYRQYRQALQQGDGTEPARAEGKQ